MLKTLVISLVFGFAGVCAGAALAADSARGSALYETRCGACHASSVHNRDVRKATSFDGLRAQVLRWSGEVGGRWSGDEIDDVTVYLNQRYYRFPCPLRLCKAEQALLAR